MSRKVFIEVELPDDWDYDYFVAAADELRSGGALVVVRMETQRHWRSSLQLESLLTNILEKGSFYEQDGFELVRKDGK